MKKMAGLMAIHNSMSEGNQKYRNLYKKKGLPWKDNFYKRCAERLKASRERVINRRRSFQSSPLSSPESDSVVRSLMKEEWRQIFGDNTEFPELGTSQEIDDINLIDEIEKELQLEEQEMIMQEFEQVAMAETSELNALIEVTSVLCPVCRIAHLTRSESSITCPCGASINNHRLSLAELHTQLMETVRLHNSSCECDPSFTSISGQLLISCCNCRMGHVIS